jgi:hypothetical protein
MKLLRYALVCSAAFALSLSANAQMQMQSPIPGIERQCVLNHPFQADIAITATGVDKDKPPMDFVMPGKVVRDSEGRQKIEMNIRLPDSDESHVMSMIFDPPAGKVSVVLPEIKKIMKRDMDQVHCAPQPTEPDFSAITKEGGKVEPLGVENIGDLKATGYHITFDRPGTDGKPTKLDMEFWTDMYQAIPVKMTMKAGDSFSMVMKFTNVKLVEPAASEFAVPAGYTEMKMPTPEEIQGLPAKK